jgi:hypothetical protein
MNRPSHPENSAIASPASSRIVGYGGTSRCPQFAQNVPLNSALQLRQCVATVEAGASFVRSAFTVALIATSEVNWTFSDSFSGTASRRRSTTGNQRRLTALLTSAV